MLDNKIKRRSLLKGAAAASALVAFPFGFSYASTPKPTRGGHLRIGLQGGSAQDSPDPTKMLYNATWLLQSTCRNNLVRLEADGTLSPQLAVSWDHSDDLKRWAFEIRSGVTFHSGKPLTVDDIITSIDMHRGEESGSPARSFVSSITEISSERDNKVIITLDEPNADFPRVLADNRLVIIPEKNGAPDRASLDGTGPYIFESFEPGQRMLFKRNPNYWNLDNAGFFDSAEVLIINDDAARMNALRTGQVDIINRADLRTVHMLERLPDVNVESVAAGQFYMFGMMANKAPFNDNNVRLALKHAINRQELVDKILFGHGSIGNDQPIDPNHRYHNHEIPQREFDPDKARHYLNKAGLSSLNVPLHVANAAFPGAVTATSLYSSSAKDAGITIDVNRRSDDGYFQNVWQVESFTADYWTKYTSADIQLTLGYSRDSSWNETRFDNDRFNELLVKARSTIDDTERKKMYHEMQQLIHDNSGAVIPMFGNYVWATSKKVRHQDSLTDNGDLDSWRCIERWWFES